MPGIEASGGTHPQCAVLIGDQNVGGVCLCCLAGALDRVTEQLLVAKPKQIRVTPGQPGSNRPASTLPETGICLGGRRCAHRGT
jgi:hypothetical protein